MNVPAICLEKVERRYDQAGSPLEVLRGADFCLWAGQSVALVAPSGAGKSTLLHVAGLLERPDGGELMIAGLSRARAKERAWQLLHYLGLSGRADHRPPELSGGEQQRVAIARAVANGPGILLADEPTGNLDPKTADHVFEVLYGLIRATGLAALIVTHNMELAARMDRRVTLHEGRVLELG